ncbi:MAG TPA: hypothetical protein VN684_00765 [Terriglobales bacterium]|nr:hypothetical protein [Terriglobales bacterium]
MIALIMGQVAAIFVNTLHGPDEYHKKASTGDDARAYIEKFSVDGFKVGRKIALE